MQQNTFNYLTFFLWLASCYRKPDSRIMNDRALSKFSNQCFYTKVHVGFNEIMARSLFSGSVDSTELTVLPYYCSETDEVPGCKFHILVSTKVPFPFLNEHVRRLHNRYLSQWWDQTQYLFSTSRARSDYSVHKTKDLN